jgi:DNA-binding LacI/PurR family transcriptional regulator
MGEKSAQMLIDIIKGKMVEPKILVLNTKLIERGST